MDDKPAKEYKFTRSLGSMRIWPAARPVPAWGAGSAISPAWSGASPAPPPPWPTRFPAIRSTILSSSPAWPAPGATPSPVPAPCPPSPPAGPSARARSSLAPPSSASPRVAPSAPGWRAKPDPRARCRCSAWRTASSASPPPEWGRAAATCISTSPSPPAPPPNSAPPWHSRPAPPWAPCTGRAAMANPFLEQQVNGAKFALYGCTFEEEYAVETVVTAGGAEYPRLIHPYPVLSFDLSSLAAHDALYTGLLDLYRRAYGSYGGFRLRHWDEWSTNGRSGAPTPTDQPLALVSGLVYQLQKQYGSGVLLAEGKPTRTLFKPVAGSVRVAIAGQEIGNVGATRWTVDITTGRVTFAADKSKAITAITQASQAVLTVGSSHGFVVNDVVQVSGVASMTQINGLRAAVTATGASTITLAINSTTFSAYTSGGVVHSAPQSGEAVTAGCEFDIPVKFLSKLQAKHSFPTHSELPQILLRERLNP